MKATAPMCGVSLFICVALGRWPYKMLNDPQKGAKYHIEHYSVALQEVAQPLRALIRIPRIRGGSPQAWLKVVPRIYLHRLKGPYGL